MIGYVALKPCGCLRGWVNAMDALGKKDAAGWLADGCTVRPLGPDEELPKFKCEQHAKERVLVERPA
jgi:hypothetical protein